jgi:hypothetical protein
VPVHPACHARHSNVGGRTTVGEFALARLASDLIFSNGFER